jgi:beta-lactamase superfamily II metal-dependent hydrolase
VGEIFANKQIKTDQYNRNVCEVSIALASEKLYLLNNLEEMQAEMLMDISLAEYVDILHIKDNLSVN